ncbi:MAG: 2-C-methyl-D-erythritol 4-phosphate cytidylyltransferase [Deferribacterales bacterium]
MKFSVIIPAGGIGKRFSTNMKKQFFKLNNKEIIYHTLFKISFLDAEEIIIGCDPYDEEDLKLILNSLNIDNYKFAPNGKERQHTVMNCLKIATQPHVFIHDAVRPFLSMKIIERLIGNYLDYDGVICGIKPNDTVKIINDKNNVDETIDRNRVLLVHTPQIFKKDILNKCLKEINERGLTITDEAMALEFFGYKVGFVNSEWYNIKITTQNDIYLAEYILNNFDMIAGG